MPARFNVNVRIERRGPPGRPRRRGVALLACVLLLAGTITLLLVNINFGRYALTGLLWSRAQGIVTSTGRTSTPRIRFVASDGRPYYFEEDYVLLCGGRSSFCFIRDFDPGEIVPVVYDPGAPARAFVHDWALFAGVISWFAQAGIGLVFALICAALLVNRPFKMSFVIGRSAGRSDSGRGA